MDSRSEEKQKRLEEALDKGIAMIHLDARRPGVVVPERFRDDHHLRLNLSWRFMPPDLTMGPWGVRETLSFGGVPSSVAVPWNAIFAISSAGSQQAWLFPEDMPPELLEQVARDAGMSKEQLEELRAKAETDLPAVAETEQPAPEKPKGFTPRIVGVPEVPEAKPPAEEPAKSPEGGGPDDDGPKPDGPDGAPRRGHLRVVK